MSTIIFLPKTLSNPDFFLNGLNRDFLVFPDTKVKGFAKRSPDMKSANGFASSEVVSPEMPQKILCYQLVTKFLNLVIILSNVSRIIRNSFNTD